jgi:HTH-type transcriptional regulator / antitoxin HigA
MDIRVIKSDEQHQHFLEEVGRLAGQDPDPSSDEGARLELLAKLVEDYEKAKYPFAKPDPVDAIIYRMEQQDLRQKDIAALLGGKSRASEILSRKRSLTLPMIRALSDELGIPASILIQEPSNTAAAGVTEAEASYLNEDVDLIVKRGWTHDQQGAFSMLQRVMASHVGSPAFLKHTITFGCNQKTHLTNVWLWLARVRDMADEREAVHERFNRAELTDDLLHYVARLSWMDNGPVAAIKFLEDRGIAVVIEPHLPKTHLDGAATLSCAGTPVIGLTVREDRLDNFWFTLIHELVHAQRHLNKDGLRAIVDGDIEEVIENEGIEKEANDVAAEILIPRSSWKRSRAYLKPSRTAIVELATQLQINPAIVAGRVRRERKKYSFFSNLVGYRRVRAMFPGIKWGK